MNFRQDGDHTLIRWRFRQDRSLCSALPDTHIFVLASRDTLIMVPVCRSKASKFFNTEKRGEGTEATEKKDNMALRAVFDRTLREAPKSFSSVASVPSPCFSVLKNLLA